MKEIILDEAYRTITARYGDRNVTVPMAQAIIRSLAVNAAKGQHRAQRLFAELLSSTERERAALQEHFFGAALDYKIAWERELARREALGIRDLPPPLPHPDHVIVDVRNGTVRMAGPATKEEMAEWDAILAEKAMLEDCVTQLRQANETETDPGEIEDNLRFIAIGEGKLERITRIMPGRGRRNRAVLKGSSTPRLPPSEVCQHGPPPPGRQRHAAARIEKIRFADFRCAVHE